MDWLISQAQTASPFIATFCLVVGGVVARILWNQLLFERSEHRAGEQDTADAIRTSAKAMERLAVTVMGAGANARRRKRRRARRAPVA